MTGSAATTTTSEPSRRKACAISVPSGPAPTTISRRGSSVSEKSVSFVRVSTRSRPSTGGIAATLPAATTK